MSNNAMEVFNKYVLPATVQTLGQMVARFNEASGGAIRLTSEGFEGDFMQQRFFDAMHSAQRRIDRYAANSNQAATQLTQGKRSAVKVAGGFGPILMEPGALRWTDNPTSTAISAISLNMAEAILQDELNTAIACLVAAIENQGATTTVDESATGALTYRTSNNAHALFGDRSSSLVATVIDGRAYHKFIDQNLANGQDLFSANGVLVTEILGKRHVITDAPALRESGSPNKVKALSLVEGAIAVGDPSAPIINIDTTNGKERIESTFQGEYDFTLEMKGYTWDETNGGKSPDDTDLGTGSNWDLSTNDIKFSAGVLAVGDADQ